MVAAAQDRRVSRSRSVRIYRAGRIAVGRPFRLRGLLLAGLTFGSRRDVIAPASSCRRPEGEMRDRPGS